MNEKDAKTLVFLYTERSEMLNILNNSYENKPQKYDFSINVIKTKDNIIISRQSISIQLSDVREILNNRLKMFEQKILLLGGTLN